MESRRWWAIVAVCAVLLGLEFSLFRNVPGYAALRETYPYFVAQSYRSLLQAVFVLILAVVIIRGSGQPTLGVLGLNREPWTGLKAAALMVTPLYVVFFLVFEITDFVTMEVLYLAAISPVAEELVYRGFAFGMLRKVARWGFWPAALLPAAFFAWGHIDQANDIVSTVMTILLTGGGALIFSWLFEKWDGLWVPIGLHVAMNLAWNIFAVGDGAYAGTLPTVMQLTTIVAALVVTRFRHRIGGQ